MGNDIAREHLVAWAAGFMDGEGSFMLSRVVGARARRRVVRRHPTLSAVQGNTREPLDRLAALFGGKVTFDKFTVTGTPIWKWRLNAAREVGAASSEMLPFLTVKRAKAEVCIAYAPLIGPRGPRGQSTGQLALRADLEAYFDSLPTKKGAALRRVV